MELRNRVFPSFFVLESNQADFIAQALVANTAALRDPVPPPATAVALSNH